MAGQGAHRERVTVEEVAISNSFEIAALVEVLDRKGVVTKAEVLEMVRQLKSRQRSSSKGGVQ